MREPHNLVPALAAIAVAALGVGCGLGPGGSSDGDVTLIVTQDYGAKPVLDATESGPPESETVIRVLDREADIETRYGGGFVQAIEGIEGGFEDGRSFDWFFYVNGIESPVGSADRPIAGGDRIWWDHRDWTEAMRVPAVVGSWPEPFLQASAGEDRLPVRVVCAGRLATCEAAQDALADAGVSSIVADAGKEDEGEAFRVVVGEWPEIREDPAARLIERGPGASGVFARVENGNLELLDDHGTEAGRAGGIVAATRNGEDPPIWVVTGTGADGVIDAVGLLDEDTLRDHYAIAVSGGRAVALPVPESAP